MIYETPESRAIEDAIAAGFARVRGYAWMRYVTADDLYGTPDHMYTLNGQIKKVSETKRRYNDFGIYTDYFIDKSKVDRLLEAALYDPNVSSIWFPIILVGFNDVIAHISPAVTPAYRTSVGGRKDRNDPNDQDMLYHFKWSVFTIVCERCYE